MDEDGMGVIDPFDPWQPDGPLNKNDWKNLDLIDRCMDRVGVQVDDLTDAALLQIHVAGRPALEVLDELWVIGKMRKSAEELKMALGVAEQMFKAKTPPG